MKKVSLIFMSLFLPLVCNAMEEMPGNPELLLIMNKASEFEKSTFHQLINMEFDTIRSDLNLNCVTPSVDRSRTIVEYVVSEDFYTYADALKDAFIEPGMKYCPLDIYKVVTRGMNDYLDFMRDILKKRRDRALLGCALTKLRPILFMKLYRASLLQCFMQSPDEAPASPIECKRFLQL
jgi:hypothetical protein